MHLRRLACLLLGAWLAGSAFTSILAFQNLRSVDRSMEYPRPENGVAVRALGGAAAARDLLRHRVLEQNRRIHEGWEAAQLLLGILLFFLLLFGTSVNKVSLLLSLSMIGGIAVSHFVLTPEVAALGRMSDFSAASLSDYRKLWLAERAYTALNCVNLLLGLTLAGKLLLRGRRRSGQATGQVDAIDKADHRHVDG